MNDNSVVLYAVVKLARLAPILDFQFEDLTCRLCWVYSHIRHPGSIHDVFIPDWPSDTRVPIRNYEL